MRAGQIDLLNLAMPIILRPAAPVSDEELMRFFEQNKPYKIERNKDGELTIMTPVGGIGSTHERYITMMLGNWTEEKGTGIDFSPSVGFNLPDGSCLSPDASWVLLERWNDLTSKQQIGFPPLCPDFLIEVRSQSDPRRAVEAKMQTWLDNGAKLAWLIDPIDGSVTIYRPNQAPETLDHPEVVKAEVPVDGFELRCARLWSPR
jgi:Uma2 family endonuclease